MSLIDLDFQRNNILERINEIEYELTNIKENAFIPRQVYQVEEEPTWQDFSGWVITGSALQDTDGLIVLNPSDPSITIASGGQILSDDYVADTSGFKIDGGTAEFNDVVVRGTIYATVGEIGGWSITATTIEDTNGYITIDSATPKIEITSSGYIQSDNFVANTSGFQIRGGEAEFQNIIARGEFRASIFTKDMIEVKGGTVIVGQSAGSLDQDWDIDGPLPVDDEITQSMVLKDPPDGGWLLSDGDIIQLRAEGGGGSIGLYGTVVRDGTTNSYTVTWKSGQSGISFGAGTPVVSWGQSGDGVITISADDTFGTGPNLSIYTHTGSPWDSGDRTLRGRIGNMNDSFGIGSNDYFGFGFGDYSGGNYIKYDSNGGFELKAGSGSVVIDESLLYLDGSYLGVGTDSPVADIHVASTGDAQILIDADTDNVGESHNPTLQLKQDGGAVAGYVTFEGDAGTRFTNSQANSMLLVNNYASHLQLGTNGVCRMNMQSDGRVGFNVVDPGEAQVRLIRSTNTSTARGLRLGIYKQVSSNLSHGDMGIYIASGSYEVDSGYTQSGYYIGIYNSTFVDSGHAGTLDVMRGYSLNIGSQSGATGHVGSVAGVYINPSQGGSATYGDVYGIYIGNMTSLDSGGYSIYSAGGDAYFADNIYIQDKLRVSGGSGTIYGTLHIDSGALTIDQENIDMIHPSSGGWARGMHYYASLGSNTEVFSIGLYGTDTTVNRAYITHGDNPWTSVWGIHIDPDGLVTIGDTSNSDMTTGLTINQRSSNNQILALKSTSVSHGGYNGIESDTFGYIEKAVTTGGMSFGSYLDSTGYTALEFVVVGNNGYGDTSKNYSGQGIIEFYAMDQSGGSISSLKADVNVFVVRGRIGATTRSLFIIDENGDYYYDGADGGAFDEYEDAHLVRALDVAGGDIIQTEFDRNLHHNEETLVETGILGDTIENGGLVNGAKLQKLHNGAIWQNYTKIQENKSRIEHLEERVDIYERALVDAGINPMGLLEG